MTHHPDELIQEPQCPDSTRHPHDTTAAFADTPVSSAAHPPRTPASMAFHDYDKDKREADRATIVLATASQQHREEQEMLLRFTIPEPPVATKQLSIAENDHPDQPRTLWMGDLDPWLDDAAIVDLWWHILGKKVSVKLIKPKAYKSDAGYIGLSHLGYCFVEFALYEDAQQALALNGQLLPDIAMPLQQHFPNNPDNQKKYFRLNWALGATLATPIVQLPEYSLFVGDLSASTTEAHLLLFFQKSFPNSIKTVRVMTDPVSGKLRCFGFVRFTDELERERALVEMNGAWFGGRPLRVALAAPRNGHSFRKLPDNPIQDYMFVPLAPYFPPPMDNQEMPMAMPYMPYLDPTNTTVFVGGLLLEVSEQTLYTLFKPFGAIQQIKIPPGKNCGFLKYSTREEAEEAILAMEGFIIGGNRVRLGWGRVSANNKKFQQRQQMAQVAQMQAAAAMSMGMDLAAAFAAAAGYPPPAPGSSQGYPPLPVGLPPPMAPAVHGMPPYMEMKDKTEELSAPERYGEPYFRPEMDKLASTFDKLSMDAPPGIFVPYYTPMPEYRYEAPKKEDTDTEKDETSQPEAAPEPSAT